MRIERLRRALSGFERVGDVDCYRCNKSSQNAIQEVLLV